jgi:Zn-dependent metalloprotease
MHKSNNMFKHPFRFSLSLVFILMVQWALATTIAGKYSSVPQYMRLDKTERVSVAEFGSWISQKFMLPSASGFKLLSTEKDALGMVHYRYQQTINAIPVEGMMYLVHTKNGLVESISGDLLDRLSAPTSPEIDKESAITSALKYVNATEYKWQSEVAEKALQENTSNTNATYYPQPNLVYVAEKNKPSNNFHLAYKMDVYAVKPLSRNYIYVDALTGSVIHTQNRIEHADVTATAYTQYSGIRDITTDSYTGGYRLREAGRGNGIRTYNALQSTNPGNTDFTNATTTWNNVNAAQDEYATDAHFASEATYDFYKTNFNRNSLDDNGLTLAAYVHYDVDLDNAFWDGGAMYYGDGSAASPYTTLDVGGHEITHGLTQYTADLNYQDESGALNESFSDCMGAAIRQSVRQFPPNQSNQIYLIGDDNGNPFRSMRTPKSYGQPDTYEGQYWYTGTADDGGVHTNSGVQNHWFYIVAQGENGTNDKGDVYSVAGIGIEKAQAITYRTLTTYLTPSSQYADARTYSILAAQDLYGACSPEVETVTNAWYAVGVGPVFNPAVTTNFKAPVTSACSVPAALQFTDASSNAIYYVWNFGDGSTSNQQNPAHTYTTYGDFTVKLMSWHPDCGYDSVIKTSLVHIEDNRPTTTDVSICAGATTTLSATGTGTIQWYDAANSGNLLAAGTSFNTPVVNQPTVYYAQNLIPGPSGVVAPPSTNIGAGGYNNFAHYTTFNNTRPQKLISVLIDAGSVGNRLIELRNSSNTVLASATVSLLQGIQTVPINFQLPVQNDLRLGIWTGTFNLYRNSDGASYPYYSTDSSLVIISNDVPDLDRFYFFYNWQLEQDPCVSERVPVAVNLLTVGCTSGIEETELLQNLSLLPNPTNNVLNVKLNAAQQNNEAKLSIQNILGETLMVKTIAINNGGNNWAVDVAGYAEGVYLLTLQSGKTNVTKRFVKSN